MKDVGSIFPLYSADLATVPSALKSSGKKKYYSLCREAIYEVAKSLGKSKVLIPAYTCDTVIAPFRQLGWECNYYGIKRNLRIDTNHLSTLCESIKPEIVVVHPYYGCDLSTDEIECLRKINNQGIKILVDLTQCIFSELRLDFVDYYTGSYRKWFAIPDGSYLESKRPIKTKAKTENTTFVQQQLDSMYLRGIYFAQRGEKDEEIKRISIRLNKSAVAIAQGNILPHLMSGYSQAKLMEADFKINQKKRKTNFRFLYNNIKENDNIKTVCRDIAELTTAPLYFTIYAKDRKGLQAALAAEHVYAPVIWPVYDEAVLISEEVASIYNEILAIPIDQRYGYTEMKRIINIINNYNK